MLHQDSNAILNLYHSMINSSSRTKVSAKEKMVKDQHYPLLMELSLIEMHVSHFVKHPIYALLLNLKSKLQLASPGRKLKN